KQRAKPDYYGSREVQDNCEINLPQTICSARPENHPYAPELQNPSGIGPVVPSIRVRAESPTPYKCRPLSRIGPLTAESFSDGLNRLMLGRLQLSSQFRNIHPEPIVTRVPITVEGSMPDPSPRDLPMAILI